MSSYTCQETYCSYGSYLRSRGYDKAICNLFNDIEAGNVKIGPIVPNGDCGVTIDGDVTIQPCTESQGTGILKLYGGHKGKIHELVHPGSLGLQAITGINLGGPFVQTGTGFLQASQLHPAGNYNAFSSDTIFTGNVTIQGDLEVDGSFNELSNEITETLTISALPANSLETFRLFPSLHGQIDTQNVQTWIDTSSSIDTIDAAHNVDPTSVPQAWETHLAFTVDGSNNDGSNMGNNGNTGIAGRTRSLMGMTVGNVNPFTPNPLTSNDNYVQYKTGSDLSNNALDVYGEISMQGGNNGAKPIFTLSGTGISDDGIIIKDGGAEKAHISTNGNATFTELVNINGTSNNNNGGLIIKNSLGQTKAYIYTDGTAMFSDVNFGTIDLQGTPNQTVLDVNNTVTNNITFTINGKGDLSCNDIISKGDVIIDGSGSIAGDLLVAGETNLNSILNVNGSSASSIAGELKLTKNTGVGLNVTKNVKIGGTLDVSGVSTFSNSINGSITGSAATLTTARTIGGVSFDGSADINLPGVNTPGNQDTTGNAATATALANARNIGGVSFDGSADINLPGVNTAGNQDTTGNADTATKTKGLLDIATSSSARQQKINSTSAVQGEMFLEAHTSVHKLWICTKAATGGNSGEWKYTGLIA